MPIRATADRRAAYFSAARARSGRASRTGRIRRRACSRLAGMYSVGQFPVRAVAPEHPAGHGGHVHLVDAVGDAHGGCRRMHGLDRREVGGAERAQDVQRVLARRRTGDLLLHHLVPGDEDAVRPDAGGGAGHYEHAVDAHHEQQAGDPPRRDEPLLAVDDPLIAVSFGTGLEQVRIAADPVGFLLNSGPTEKSHALAQRVAGGLRQDGPAPGRTRLGRRQEPAGEAVVSHVPGPWPGGKAPGGAGDHRADDSLCFLERLPELQRPICLRWLPV